MEYNLPFKIGCKIAEFGGGPNCIFHPNYDIRKLPGVDYVIDFNKSPLPIENESLGGIYCRYMLEHLNWRRLRSFLSEVFRILSPGGIAVFVTADLREQARVLVNNPKWDDKMISMIFGDQNFEGDEWDQNAHHCGYSPEYITGILDEIGFVETKIISIQTEVGPTDMIIEAHKLERESDPMIIKDAEYKEIKTTEYKVSYDRAYFDGDSKQGYHPPGYQNFPSNYTIANEIIKMSPESVLELGGCRGYISHIIEGKGINATCLDIAKHCFYTRACKHFVLADATERLPFEDKQFDLVFSKDFLEHIPEEKVDSLIKEIWRVSKRGFHLITFSDHPHARDDNTHQCIKPKDWWIEKFKSMPGYNCTIDDKEKYEYTDLDLIKKFHTSMK